MRSSAIGILTAILVAPPVFAQAPTGGPQTAVEPPGPLPAAEPPPPAVTQPAAVSPAPPPQPIVSKADVTLYGIVDMTVFYDSVQFNGGEAAGNAILPREDSFAADHSRLQFSPRGSRIGLRLAAPEYSGVKVSG